MSTRITTRTKSLQKELAKIKPFWLFMSLDVTTIPLKSFMFQMKGGKWNLVDIKSIMKAEILFCMIDPSSWISTIEARKI